MRRTLECGGLDVITKRVDTELDFVIELAVFVPDLVLLDYTLPRYDENSCFGASA